MLIELLRLWAEEMMGEGGDESGGGDERDGDQGGKEGQRGLEGQRVRFNLISPIQQL